MATIPTQDKKFIQTNRSDVSGNINYSKNLNLSEEGYLKLSSRSIALISDNSVDSNFDVDFNTTYSLGRTTDKIYLVTQEKPFIVNLSPVAFGVAEDADSGVQTQSVNSRGVWWQNRWYTTNQTTTYYKTISSGAWTNASIALTTGLTHALEVFRNRNTLCISNGNAIIQVDSSHATGTLAQLSLPSDYEIMAMAYSNNKLGIITRLSSTVIGQDQDAYFFTWDGTSSSANLGVPIGSSDTVGIVPYKGQWVILTKQGQLLYFNGGGWQELAVLPFYSRNRILANGTLDALGDCLIVEGERIYINLSGDLNSYGMQQVRNMQEYPAGIWCYEPEVGLYHEYSPSISMASTLTVSGTDVNTTNDTMTISGGVIPETGNPIKLIFNPNIPIGGLLSGNVYYIIKHTSSVFSVAETRADSLIGNKINLTGTGDTTNYLLALNLIDYGQTLGVSTGGIVTTVTKTPIYDHILYSGKNYNASGTTAPYIQMTSGGFDNIGYFVTPKITSGNVIDVLQKVYIKYKPLKDTDSITIKYKDEQVFNLPTFTPQLGRTGTGCIWTSSTTLTTTFDLSDAMDYLDDIHELECEIISGAGAGQMSQISSITYNAGTYTVTLSDEMLGVTNANQCNVIIDNWKMGATIDVDTLEIEKGWQEIGIDSQSKDFKLKVILKGVETTIEELQIINKGEKSS